MYPFDSQRIPKQFYDPEPTPPATFSGFNPHMPTEIWQSQLRALDQARIRRIATALSKSLVINS